MPNDSVPTDARRAINAFCHLVFFHGAGHIKHTSHQKYSTSFVSFRFVVVSGSSFCCRPRPAGWGHLSHAHKNCSCRGSIGNIEVGGTAPTGAGVAAGVTHVDSGDAVTRQPREH